MDEIIARFDVENRRYHSPGDGELPSTEAVRNEGEWFSCWYYSLALSHGQMDVYREGDWLSDGQANTDLTQLAAVLELHRRAAGEYPDTLQTLAPQFPEGLPHELVSGEPYLYEKTADGGYRLSVPSIPRSVHAKPPVISRPGPPLR